MTFLELCQKTRRDIGIQGTGPTAVTGQTGNYQRLVDFVADADVKIQCLYEDWDFLRTIVSFNTVASSSTYTQSAITSANAVGKWDIEAFSFKPDTANYRPLDNLDFHAWKNSGVRFALDPEDEPTQFVLDQDESIILTPTPDAIYPIRAEHWAAPVRMAANADVSVIPKRFHQIIIELATIKYAGYDENEMLLREAKIAYDDVWLPRLEAAELRGSKKSFASHDTDFTVVPQ